MVFGGSTVIPTRGFANCTRGGRGAFEPTEPADASPTQYGYCTVSEPSIIDAILVDESKISTCLPEALKTIIDGDRFPQMSADSQKKDIRLVTPDTPQQSFENFARRLGLDPGHST